MSNINRLPRSRFAVVSLSIVFLVLSGSGKAFADKVKLKSGEEVRGEIIAETGDEITIKTEASKYVLPKEAIEEIELDVVEIETEDGEKFVGKFVSDARGMVTIEIRRRSASALKSFDKGELVGYEWIKITKKPEIWQKVERKRSKLEKKMEKKATFEEATEELSEEEIGDLIKEAFEFFNKRDYKKAEKIFLKVLKSRPKHVNTLYNLTCLYAQWNKLDKAEKYLRLAVLAGYSDMKHLEADSDLAPLRGSKFFKELLKESDQIKAMAAERTLERLKEKFGGGYTFEIDENRKFIFAAKGSIQIVKSLKTQLEVFADAHWETNFDYAHTSYLTIIYPTTEDYSRLLREYRLGRGVAGWYSSRGNMLITSTLGSTLYHEFTHAMHQADKSARRQHHPIWLTEGIAGCYETSTIYKNELVPSMILSNRFQQIKRDAQGSRFTPLGTFCTMSQGRFMRNAMTHYAQSRYFLVYLFKKQVLSKWYKEYVKAYAQDRSGIKTLEKVLGKSLVDIEKDFRDWVLTLPATRGRGGRVSIGASAANLPAKKGGVGFSCVTIGGPADRGGVRYGDNIIHINGRQILNEVQFRTVVSKLKPGKAVVIQVRRGRKKKTLQIVPEVPQRQGRPGGRRR
ncbi:MAG: PDZ domain-containing protein [Planctomycetota bacterium]|nr:MAG: PDZ domain-containing protein [Planctomycetota bacterium]